MAKILLQRLQETFGDAIVESGSFQGDEWARVPRDRWHEIAKFLHDDARCQCDYFVDLSAVDDPDRSDHDGGRFEVYLIVYSITKKHRIRLKTRLTDAAPKVATLSDVWKGANWAERECWDMFGVEFQGHPDLRRILMYEEFEGHPLRKDYPANRTQPLMPYREGTVDKLGPFFQDEGMPLNRSPREDERPS